MHALRESIQQELERSSPPRPPYPHLDLHSVYFGLHRRIDFYDNALEFLENVLKSPLRRHLVPLLDGKLIPSRELQSPSVLCAQKAGNREQAVAELVASDDPWLKSLEPMPSAPLPSSLWK